MPRLDTTTARRIASARAMIFDMDGTLVVGDAANGSHRALPGAADLLTRLRSRGIPFRVFTNGTAKPPVVYAEGLREAGLDVADDEMMTPSTTAADWFRRRKIARVRVLGLDGVQAPLRAAGLEVVGPFEKAGGIEAVFTGFFREFTFPALEAACGDVWAGAMLTTASNTPFFATANGRGISVSYAINTMICGLTGKSARVLGKPSRAALDCAMRHMGLPLRATPEIVVCGDDPDLEIRMANAAGAISLGVTSGLADAARFEAASANDRPCAVLGGVGEVLEALA